MQKQSPSSEHKPWLSVILLSAALCFTVWFFTPAEIFIRNQQEFVVHAGHILLPMLLTAAVCSLGFILILKLSQRCKPLYTVLSRLMLGVLLAFYTQELFFNGKMTLLSGAAVQESSITAAETYLNFALMYTIAMLPLILSFSRQKHPENKLLRLGGSRIIPYLSAVILVMQTGGLISSLAQFGLGKYKQTDERTLSYEPAVSLSTEKNIVVFLVDFFDGMYMDSMLESDPSLYEEFEGFTFYQDNISCYPGTFPSVPNLLTQQPFAGETYAEYFSRAWQRHTVLDDLKADGYRVNLLLDQPTTYNDLHDLESRCDNIVPVDKEEYQFNYLGRHGVIPTMSAMSYGKLLPYLFKNLLFGIDADFSSYFRNLDTKSDAMPDAVGVRSDLKFYRYLTEHGLTTEPQKAFCFTHLIGCHDFSAELAELYKGTATPGAFLSAYAGRGDLEILFEYFRQMKALGVFDCSTIIVLGDHGHHVFLDEDSFDFTSTTALLIKPEGAPLQPLQINEDAVLSNSCFAAGIMEYAGLAHGEYGVSYSDVTDRGAQADRYYHQWLWRGGDTQPAETLYLVDANARERDSWSKVNPTE